MKQAFGFAQDAGQLLSSTPEHESEHDLGPAPSPEAVTAAASQELPDANLAALDAAEEAERALASGDCLQPHSDCSCNGAHAYACQVLVPQMTDLGFK